MENVMYVPSIYEGNDPYIYISFHHNDKTKIIDILEMLDKRGFRFWNDDGIIPGLETDEIIAEHIENCDFFIAFVSNNYLNSIDKVDELNYSRDTNKDYLLVYIEDVSLPAGLDMRFIRSESIKAYTMTNQTLYSKLLMIDGASKYYGITDKKLQNTANRLFEKLEELYPDHKVFALDAVAKQLSRSLSGLYILAGYSSVAKLLQDYGFTQISVEDARLIRSSVLYQPGFEPQCIKPRIDYIMNTLISKYPDKKITDNLRKTNKSIYKSLSGLSVWLGYSDVEIMLLAYGFELSVIMSTFGRNQIDSITVINELQSRYKRKSKPTSLTMLIRDNSDMIGNLKTLSNRSMELFGVTFLQHLKNIGLIVPKDKDEKTSLVAKNRVQIIEKIKNIYNSPEFLDGKYSDVENTLSQIIVKKTKNDQICITDCGSCDATVNIPYGIDYINKEAFAGQSNMEVLIIPSTVKEIGEAAFADCDSLTTIILSEGLEKIGNNAFSRCTALENIKFPNSLKDIGSKAFSGCNKLSEVEFKNIVVNVKRDAFEDCIYDLETLRDNDASSPDLFEIKVVKNNNAKIINYLGQEEIVVVPCVIAGSPVISIEKGCFKDNNYVKQIYIDDKISSINGDVFKDCKNLEKIHISEAVNSINKTAFSGCVNLREINIPNNMIEIQKGLLKDSPITTLYIGKKVEKISADAFYKGNVDLVTGRYEKDKTLENLIIDADNDHFIADGTAILSKDGKTVIAELGNPTKVQIPEGVEEISPLAYDRLGKLEEVKLPSTLKVIGEKAFAQTNIKNIEFPKSLKIVANQAFSYCRNLKALDINEGLEVIGDQTFEGCPIEDVYIPASVKSIGNNSFLSLSTYQGNIDQSFRIDMANANLIADGIALYQKIDGELNLVKAYAANLRLKPNEVNLEPVHYKVMEGTTNILAHAFARCDNLKSIVIPEGVRSIGDLAFWDCSNLKTINIPNTCQEVSPKAFFGTTINIV